MIPPLVNTNPGKKYNAKNLDYGMTIGIERTPGGRIWACWVGGGDNANAFFVLAWSDDEGKKWTKTKVVIDPHDESLPLKRRTIVGQLWTDPLGRLWLFFDQAMTYYDGRSGNWYTLCENPDFENPVWSEPVYLGIGCTLQKPTVMSSGEWVLPVSIWPRSRMDILLEKGWKGIL
ncbi:glycoside hydrolase [Bacteroides intestinalis]|uniref:sialidase family protein n=1 Tax=Bacteroides intestinalis TaxID=329854 RepID=UPI001EDADE97|nr:sialidase family protein [Bacteroides intestinalis]MCG4736526.1 glycoside hydrolase [Bacteroides intestinalis]